MLQKLGKIAQRCISWLCVLTLRMCVHMCAHVQMARKEKPGGKALTGSCLDSCLLEQGVHLNITASFLSLTGNEAVTWTCQQFFRLIK